MTDTQPTGLQRRLAAARRSLAVATPAIPARPDPAAVATLSPAQARLWFVWQLDPASSAYNLPVVLKLTGPLDETALLAAVREVAERHVVLRTVVREEPTGLVGLPVAADRVPVTVVDTDDEHLDRVLHAETERPFALDREPPMRASLLRMDHDRHVLALTFHHIAMDAGSEPVLLGDLAAAYAARIGLGEPPAPPRLQYADVADWQAAQPSDAGLDWWADRLAGLAPVLDLPADRHRGPSEKDTGGTVPITLPAGLSTRIRALAAESGCSPFMVLLAGWQALLGRLADVDDVAVGVPEAGRHHPDVAAVVGCFLNTVVMRTDLAGEPTGRALLARVREVVLDAFTHASTPFDRVVERVAPQRDLTSTPLFQVMLNVYDDAEPPTIPGVVVEQLTSANAPAKYDLNLALGYTGTAYSGDLSYRSDLFDQDTVERIAGWFERVLTALTDDPDRPIGDVPLADVTAPAFAGPPAGEPITQALHTAIERWCDRTPDAIAVVGDGTLTYGELERRANRIAHRLIAQGVRADQPVGILLDAGADLVCAYVGIQKSGAAYLPFDTGYPAARIATLIDTAGVGVVVTTTTHAGLLAGTGVTVIAVDAVEAVPDTRPDRHVPADSLLHVIFTSGSTGTPKAVATEHRHVGHYLRGMLERLGDVAGRSFAMVSTPAADFGLTCVYGALTTGGTVHMVDREVATDPGRFAAYLAEHRVDVLKCVPSHLELLAAHGDLAAVLPRELLVLGGEACPWRLVERVRAVAPDLRLQSHYGHTESTMIAMTCDPDRVPESARTGIVPLGDALPGVVGHLVDRAGRPVPPGVPGELVIGGPAISRGYLNNAEATAARFTADPIGGGTRCYRSGDRLLVRKDGTVEFRGRVDDQVKVRGYRVELGEVTSALLALPDVAEAVVLPVGEGGNRALAAWVVGDGADPAAVRRALRDRLPDYMIPAAVTVLDRMPLNPNGKIDRARLPAPTVPVAGGGTPPRTATERAVAQVWCEVLGRDAVGVEDDFFALGGHSFGATRVVARLRATLGRPVQVRLLFERPVLAEFAEGLDLLPAATEPEREPIPARSDVSAPSPLSPAQARLWFLDQYEEDSSAYTSDTALRLRGPLDVPALLAAVRDVAERNHVLRSVIREVGGEPMAFVQPVDAVPVSTVEVSDEFALLGLLDREQHHRFRLDREPPLRAVLYRLGAHDHVLALTVHHIATDNRSRGLIADELAACYRARLGAGAAPAPVRRQYADYANWLRGNGDQTDVGWWAERLAGLPPVLEVPTDRPRGAVADGAAGEVEVVLPTDLTARLRTVCAETGCTPFMVLLAAWQALLSRLTDVQDLAVGVPESGRHHPDVEDMIGCFIGTLVMRADLTGDPTGRELLARTRDWVLGAFGHADVPFQDLVDAVCVDRDTATTPLFQIMLNVLDEPGGDPEFPGVAVDALPPLVKTAKFDLELGLVRTGDTYEGKLVHRADLFDEATARRMVGWYLTVLDALVREPDAPVLAAPLAPAAPALTGAPAAMAGDGPVHTLVERWADRTPDATAVVGPRGALTYRELDDRANRIAHRLLAEGVRADQPVGVVLDNGTDLMCALQGIHKAGGAYMPFDTAFPAARTAGMLSVAGARIVVTHKEFAPRFADGAVRVVVLDDPATLDGLPATRPVLAIDLDDLAHVIFTSGSTGVPKGVSASHRNVLHRLTGIHGLLGDAAGGAFAVVSTAAADFGLTPAWGALTTGGSVHLIDRETAVDPDALSAYFARHPIDLLKLVPSHLELLAGNGDLARLLPRKLLVVAGEACPWNLVERVRAVRPDLRMQSHYGHTESTMFSFSCDVDLVTPAARGGIVPLGVPLPGAVCHLVDRAGRPVPTGVPGELVIGGPGVTRGYVNNAELTAEKFVEFPVGGGERCYRSGDLLRVTADGTVEFRGRVDDQVQIRGHRVELGEVTTALLALPDIAEAVVLAVGEGQQRRLAAWLVPTAGSTVDTSSVRTRLRHDLPDHMVPTALVPLERLPLNANGKIDRAALPAPQAEQAAVKVAPSTPNQLLVAGVFAEVLGVAELGIDDDFFASGGNSFAAVRVVRGVGHGLRIIDLFMNPTVRGLAAVLDNGADGAEAAGSNRFLHRLGGPAGSVPVEATVVCVPYGGGSSAVYQPVAAQLGDKFRTLGVELPGHDPARPDEVPLDIDDLVEQLAEEVSATVTGPVVVYGHCVGSAIATALARRLEADGRVELTGVVVAGSFPAARLPGRISKWVQRKFPSERWVSDRLFRDTLRATGGLMDDMDERTVDTMLRAMRHDARQAQAWFGRELADAGSDQARARLRAPLLCLVGERDRTTEMHQERYREWGVFAQRVGVRVVPGAGHYFLRHQAAEVAEVIRTEVRQWQVGRRPEPVADPFVGGAHDKAGLRAFYTVAGGQLVSMIGNALSSFALGVWAYQRSGRIMDLALVLLLAQIPTILLTPIGGAVADRVDRRKIMLWCDVASGVAMACLATLMALDQLNMVAICSIVGVTAVSAAFQAPAYLAAIAQLVPKPYLLQANALAELGLGVGTVLGPLAGGALVVWLGLTGVVTLDVLTFVIGVATLLAVRWPNRMFVKQDEPFGKALTGGWRFIVRRKPMLVMIGYFAVVNYFTAVMWVGVTPLVLDTSGAGALGVVEAIGGVGAIVGAVVATMWGGTRRRATGMIAFVVGSGIGVVIMGLTTAVAVIALGFFVRLACMSLGNAHWLSIIQTKVGHELQGRVLAVNMMLAAIMQPLGFLTTGPLTDHVFTPLANGPVGDLLPLPHNGVALLMAVSGLLLAIWGVLGLRYRRLRYMEDLLPDVSPPAVLDADLDKVQDRVDELVTR